MKQLRKGSNIGNAFLEKPFKLLCVQLLGPSEVFTQALGGPDGGNQLLGDALVKTLGNSPTILVLRAKSNLG